MHARLSIAIAVLGFVALLAAGPARSAAPSAPPLGDQIHALLDAEPADAGDAGTATLRRFYAARAYVPAWVGDPARMAALAAVLAAAPAQGLAFPVPRMAAADGDAARDLALTRVALAYATALAAGRVALDRIEQDWAIPAPDFDAAAGLQAALGGDLAAWYDGLPPHHAAYRRLVAALARYRAIAGNGGWAAIPGRAPLKLGMVDDRVRALRQRLAAEGDLAPGLAPASPAAPVAAAKPAIERIAAFAAGAAPAAADAAPDPAATFDPDVEAAVRRFQRRNGIAVDGAAGPRTLAALNVPVQARLRQIALNLERWRSLPHDLGTSYMMVNVPAEALDIVKDGVPVIDMKVVVGDPDHPTPVVRATMAAVTFNPVWTIPSSIVTGEILPKAKRDRTYLARNDIVLTPGRGWQQMPGPKNPLGQIKFESPNRFDVYLHDTPSRIAFDRFFRAQSHGCVRLERAAELAGFVLQGTGWDGESLAQAVASGANRRVELKRRWRIYLLYATSFVDEDGTVEFRDDLYGRDARLREALGAAPAGPAQRQTGL